MDINKEQEYIGGFDKTEIDRLNKLAQSTEEITFKALENAGLSTVKNVLDVGCGPGNLSLAVASRFRHLSVTGLDISENFISEAKSKAQQIQLENVSFQCGNVLQMDIKDSLFDCVICRFLLQHIANTFDAIGEIKRVMKENAVLISIETDWAGQIIYPESKLIKTLKMKSEEVLATQGVDVNIGRKMPALLRNNGFSIEKAYVDMQTYCGDNIDIAKSKLKGRIKLMEKLFVKPEKMEGKIDVSTLQDEVYSVMNNPDLLMTDCRFIVIARRKQ
jgi:SAM-dependent methyltransferase